MVGRWVLPNRELRKPNGSSGVRCHTQGWERSNSRNWQMTVPAETVNTESAIRRKSLPFSPDTGKQKETLPFATQERKIWISSRQTLVGYTRRSSESHPADPGLKELSLMSWRQDPLMDRLMKLISAQALEPHFLGFICWVHHLLPLRSLYLSILTCKISDNWNLGNMMLSGKHPDTKGPIL